MKNSTVLTDNLMYVPADIFPSISRYIINKEDVYITVAGTIGAVGTIPPELDGANLTENADRLVFTKAASEKSRLFLFAVFAVTWHTVCGVSSLSLPELRRRHAGLLPEYLAEIGGRGKRQRFQRTLFEFIRHSIAC